MIELLRRTGCELRKDNRGLTTVEYTIVLCLIAALCVGVWKSFGDQVKGYIGGARDKINTNVAASVEADDQGG